MSLYIVIYNYLRFNNTHSLTQNFPDCRPHSLPTFSYIFDLPEDDQWPEQGHRLVENSTLLSHVIKTSCSFQYNKQTHKQTAAETIFYLPFCTDLSQTMYITKIPPLN